VGGVGLIYPQAAACNFTLLSLAYLLFLKWNIAVIMALKEIIIYIHGFTTHKRVSVISTRLPGVLDFSSNDLLTVDTVALLTGDGQAGLLAVE
jgi:hypothetical protein